MIMSLVSWMGNPSVFAWEAQHVATTLEAAERHFHSGLIHKLREKFEENLKVNRKSNETQLSFKQ